jgi:hypothetical protein
MKIEITKDDTSYYIFLDGVQIGEIEKVPDYILYPYIIYIDSYRIVIDGHNCFKTIAIAKKLVRKYIKETYIPYLRKKNFEEHEAIQNADYTWNIFDNSTHELIDKRTTQVIVERTYDRQRILDEIENLQRKGLTIVKHMLRSNIDHWSMI